MSEPIDLAHAAPKRVSLDKVRRIVCAIAEEADRAVGKRDDVCGNLAVLRDFGQSGRSLGARDVLAALEGKPHAKRYAERSNR